MAEKLHEYVDSRGAALAVDLEAGTVRGVKVLGIESQNGRHYSLATIRAAAPKYEGARVNIDHARKPGDPRSYTERFGRLSNVRVAEDGLYGDLAYNPKHALAGQFGWDAANSPANVGLSHTIDARVKRRDGVQHVESIERVWSVDLVADPATVAGLFEHVEDDKGETDPMADKPITIAMLREQGVFETIQEEILATADRDGEAAALKVENAKLTASLKEATAKLETIDKLTEIDELLAECNVPVEAITELFRKQCVAAQDTASLKALIEDRKAIAGVAATKPAAGGGKPKSILQAPGKPSELAWESMDAKQYAAAITE